MSIAARLIYMSWASHLHWGLCLFFLLLQHQTIHFDKTGSRRATLNRF